MNPGKKKGKIQMRELNAPLRVDKDYISYRISPDSLDDHVHQNCEDTPFFQFGFGCISGFAIDRMHTWCFWKEIERYCLREGRGPVEQRAVDYR